ncbi:Hypothetical protein FKW44_013842 [Caligus rogercresseyi]|uniref:Uncharacterized protein n=1 Tax=Caligus rogercresseyi TaxID=217165 RepID=A0A7T8GYY1_CALRO|nr:Hypothetical protein FKW44_013842 [Caligus rogercresseyi]
MITLMTSLNRSSSFQPPDMSSPVPDPTIRRPDCNHVTSQPEASIVTSEPCQPNVNIQEEEEDI